MSDVCPEWRGRERGVQYRSNWQSLTGSKSLLQPTEYRRDRISPVLPAFLPHLVAILHWQEFSWDDQGRAVTFQVKILSPVKTRNGPTQLIDYSHNLTQSYDLFLFQTQTSKYFVLGITSPPTHPCLWKVLLWQIYDVPWIHLTLVLYGTAWFFQLLYLSFFERLSWGEWN